MRECLAALSNVGGDDGGARPPSPESKENDTADGAEIPSWGDDFQGDMIPPGSEMNDHTPCDGTPNNPIALEYQVSCVE